MKIISHRGNVRGPIPEKENRPSYIDCALGNGYDVEGALKNGILYPSLDPSIFEVKFPLKDIRGEVIGTNTNQGGYA